MLDIQAIINEETLPPSEEAHKDAGTRNVAWADIAEVLSEEWEIGRVNHGTPVLA